jgi:hypothetical protein
MRRGAERDGFLGTPSLRAALAAGTRLAETADAETLEAMNEKRQMLRHALATLAYRGGKTLRGAPTGFAEFRTGDPSRAAVEILAHMGDLFDWALSMAKGAQAWREAMPLPWVEEVARFHATLKTFDDYLASDAPLHAPEERLFQGPIADALTHVGQLAMMRRMSGAPTPGENYFAADIQIGRVGVDQAPARRPF